MLQYKQLKLHEETYHRLDKLRIKRATFDDVVVDLLDFYHNKRNKPPKPETYYEA